MPETTPYSRTERALGKRVHSHIVVQCVGTLVVNYTYNITCTVTYKTSGARSSFFDRPISSSHFSNVMIFINEAEKISNKLLVKISKIHPIFANFRKRTFRSFDFVPRCIHIVVYVSCTSGLSSASHFNTSL